MKPQTADDKMITWKLAYILHGKRGKIPWDDLPLMGRKLWYRYAVKMRIQMEAKGLELKLVHSTSERDPFEPEKNIYYKINDETLPCLFCGREVTMNERISSVPARPTMLDRCLHCNECNHVTTEFIPQENVIRCRRCRAIMRIVEPQKGRRRVPHV